MPDGFIGKQSKKYLSIISNALTSAHTVHKSPINSNYDAPCSEEDAMYGSYKTGVGDSSNVVIDEQAYEEIAQRIRRVDAEIAESLNQIAEQIEQMCRTIYVVPTTTPKYLETLTKVKSSLSEFQSLAERTVSQAQSFVNDMSNIG
ncbi:MAG: hypothetical protein LBL82_01610 [Oscillospiraceae bacterium]|jgi:hypothetical protein|nr:hypothetical protein [Oscillospiraceae bacterium]